MASNPTTRYLARQPIFFLLAFCSLAFADDGDKTISKDPKAPVTTPVYNSDFAKRIDADRWSHTPLTRTPGGKSILIPGLAVRFNQTELPEHQFIRARIRLVILGTQDGSDPVEGPDNFALLVEGGSLLLLTNFRNPGKDDARGPADGIGQSFPDEFPAGLHASQTGAVGVGKLGLDLADATYEIEVVFPHRGGELRLEFQEGMRKHSALKDEKWGIESLEIEAISGPAVRTEEEMAALWKALIGKQPLAANKAVWEFVASGRKGADYVDRMWNAFADAAEKEAAARRKKLEADVEKLIGDLEDESFLKRVEAASKLRKLNPDAIPQLEKVLAANPGPQTRVVLIAVVKSLRAKAVAPGGDANHRTLVGSRVARVARIHEIAESGRRITASSAKSPLASLDDGFVPAVMSGHVIPRFDWWESAGGKAEWVQYEFPEAKTFDSAEVFWFENRAWTEGAKLPESWSLSYRDGDEWKPVKAKGEYTISFGKFDGVEFEPVKTRAIRLDAKSSPANRMGLIEFRLGEKAGEAAAAPPEPAEETLPE